MNIYKQSHHLLNTSEAAAWLIDLKHITICGVNGFEQHHAVANDLAPYWPISDCGIFAAQAQYRYAPNEAPQVVRAAPIFGDARPSYFLFFCPDTVQGRVLASVSLLSHGGPAAKRMFTAAVESGCLNDGMIFMLMDAPEDSVQAQATKEAYAVIVSSLRAWAEGTAINAADN